MAQQKTDDKSDRAGSRSTVAALRLRVAQLIWLVCVVCALFLAVGALLVSLGANEDNPLVSFVLRGADAVDLEVFARRNGIFEFGGENAQVRNALVNWGIGAVVYLVVGRVLDRVVRP
jgi:hypothetical protein